MGTMAASLREKYEIVKLSVVSATKISSRAPVIVARLSEEQQKDDKHVVIMTTAKSRCANKLISIVEIAKRELATNGTTCYQYNELSSELVDIPRETKKAYGNENGSDGNDPAENSDDAFQTMSVPVDPTKKRSKPSLTVYLSSVPVKELKAAFGYVRAH